MRRFPVPLLVCLLALFTAVALLRTEAVLTVPAPALAPDRAEDHKDVVRRFYNAVNAALATGDLAPLKAVVAPDFVAHAPRPGLPPNRAGLERELTALHGASPDLRLTAATVLADGDQVVSQVKETHAPATFLGLPLPPRPVLWGAVDRFRVEDDRITEHWGTVERGWLAPLARAPLHLFPPAWRAATLERRTIAPGARPDVRTVGPRLLVLETGRLTVAVAATSPAEPGVVRLASRPTAAPDAEATSAPIPPGSEVTLEPGQVVLFAQGTRAAVRSTGRTEAATLEVTIEPPGTANEYGRTPRATNAARPVDVVPQPLAGDVVAPLPTGDVVLAVGRIVLAPGAALPAHAAVGPELLAVEAGTLELTTSEGRAWGLRGVAGPRELNPATAVAAGAGMFLEPGSVAAFGNGGDAPLVFLVATLLPVTPTAATPIP